MAALAQRRFVAATEPLEPRYTLRRPAEVTAFLEASPFLPSLLSTAYDELTKHVHFSQAFLEVVADPESEHDKQLVVSVVPDGDPIKADRQMSAFDNEWWLDHIAEAEGQLCITLEFR